MVFYIARRLGLIIPTIFAVMLVNFIVIQLAPGGPIERIILQLRGHDTFATGQFNGLENELNHTAFTNTQAYQFQGIDPQIIQELQEQFGFDKPVWQRFFDMIWKYICFDFGESFFSGRPVIDLIGEKMPVSISLGLWSTILIYSISIPLGIRKAIQDGSRFDIATSWVIVIGYAIPSFLLAVFLIIFFAGDRFLNWFPLRSLASQGWEKMSYLEQTIDYMWHMALPVTAITVGGFATLTMLTKNSFIDEISKTYVLVAKAKGLSQTRILYDHIFRNAMLIIIAGFPSTLIGILFTGSLLIEIIFSLDGLGLLGYESIINRDYPVIFATLFLFTLLALMLNLISDIIYTIVDPRIDFQALDQR